MRIGLIAPGFSADEHDWCIPALFNLARGLARRHAVTVFATRYPPRRAVYRVAGATVHAFGGGTTSGLGRLPLLGRALVDIVGVARRDRLDLLHGLWAVEPGFLAVVAGRLVGRPALVSLLGGELVALPELGYGGQLSRLNRWLTRGALRRAARVTVGSASLAALAAPHIPGTRLRRWSLGVDTTLFQPAPPVADAGPLTAGALNLLHVAALVPVKDQATLLRALAAVTPQAPPVHLHLVGDGPLRPDLERLAARLDLTARVTFHGAVAHDRLPDYYRAADLCVLSSRYESQSLVVLEAAACARATVGTAVGLLPELAPAGWTVPPGDPAALAGALLTALADRPASRRAGQAALATVSADYTLERTLAALEGLYGELSPAAGGRA